MEKGSSRREEWRELLKREWGRGSGAVCKGGKEEHRE